MHYIRHKCINSGEVYIHISRLIQTVITTLESVLSLDECTVYTVLSHKYIATLYGCNILD